MSTGAVSTLAGSGASSAVDGTGLLASFQGTRQIAVDPSNSYLYVADFSASKVRRVAIASAVVTSWGSGTSANVDGLGTAVQFNSPDGLAVDSNGIVFVSSYNGNTIRRITPLGLTTTISGSAASGYAEGAGAAAKWVNPLGLAFDAAGSLIVSDAVGHRIRRLNVTSPSLVSAAAAVCDGVRWRHLAVTYTNASGGLITLAVDGVAVATKSASIATADSAAAGFSMIGSAFAAEGLTGAIDDIRVYSRALSASELATLAQPLLPT